MKKIIYTVLGFFLAITVCSCGIISQTGTITVKNNSGSTVTDIVLTYTHGNDGEQTKTIDSLINGAVKTVSAEVAHASWQTYVAGVAIEYIIGGMHFGENDETGHGNNALTGGHEVVFTIYADTWTVITNY
ncbi:hypothetical protein FACS1894172_08920 [Spirochaetia bacterium]|nr:hypothetical protein FACS1894164_20390 [Spirochaetia bacterium]GHU32380.1 hypothetical protein FACS1894172_08920 [Spirochaetia bacterium]